MSKHRSVEPLNDDEPMRLPADRSNASALELIERWLKDETGYDEAVWPILRALIEENRLSSRPRFDDDVGLLRPGVAGMPAPDGNDGESSA